MLRLIAKVQSSLARVAEQPAKGFDGTRNVPSRLGRST